MYSELQIRLLKALPKVDELMRELSAEAPHAVRIRACRETVDGLRAHILSGPQPDPALVDEPAVREYARARIEELQRPSLRPVINATGVIIHTNLGRSLLPSEIFQAMMDVAGRYSTLEYNLDRGVRGSRYSHVEDLLRELTGAEAALVVNNNAAAVLITLETLARGREVVVSRGELVEIGGSFRIPDVMARSGAVLREVGATNRTHLRDYEEAIGPDTALLLKVHQSNFQVVGFTKSVPVAELAELAKGRGLLVFEDLGSGSLVDFSRFGLLKEPTVQEAIAAGADVVTFSGDKLLGGPQAGIILGRQEIVERIQRNPLNRALRIDKLTLVALERILRLYRDPERAIRTIPTLRMISLPLDAVRARARRLLRRTRRLDLPGFSAGLTETVSRVGGGALPMQQLRSLAVTLTRTGGPVSPAGLEAALRANEPPVIVRIENDCIILDVRTLLDTDIPVVERALASGYHKARRGDTVEGSNV